MILTKLTGNQAKKTLTIGLSILIFTFAIASVTAPMALAQQTVPCPPGTASGPGNVCLPTGGGQPTITRASEFIIFVINILLALAGLVAVVFLIIGGFQYIVARGNEEATEGAKKTIFNAIIGLLIVIFAFVIIRVIQNALVNRQV